MSQDPVSEIRQPPRPRWDSIDFWRGLLFCTIFINHVPGNIFENLTSRNIGFSDAAEGFIFLSGVSLALAYGGRFAGAGAWKATRTMVGRAVRLYGAHIALSLGALAIFGIGAMVGVDPSLTDDHGRGFVFAHPIEGLIGIVSLGHQLGYFNILPLYLLMLLWAPLLLWLSRRSVPLMLTLSAAVYVVTRLKGWNLPTWPVAGSWFFDPLAWQVLLAVGIACGLRQHTTPLPRTLPLVGVALLVAAFAAWSVSNGLFLRPGLQDATRRWADLDKTMLGTGRLIHFAALAYLLYAARAAERLRGLALFKPLCADWSRLASDVLLSFGACGRRPGDLEPVWPYASARRRGGRGGPWCHVWRCALPRRGRRPERNCATPLGRSQRGVRPAGPAARAGSRADCSVSGADHAHGFGSTRCEIIVI